MATFAVLALKNAAAAVVNFAQLSRDKAAAMWCENMTAAMAAWRTFMVSNKVPSRGTQSAYRAYAKLTFPVLDATTGKYNNIIFNTEVVVPQQVAQADTGEALARFRAGVGDQVFTDLVQNKTVPF